MPKIILIIIIGFCTFVYGAYIPIKAELGQYLIRDAWNKSITTKQPIYPWKWSDTYPVLRLESKKHKQDLIVLAGDTGNVLAFGPGLSSSTINTEQSSTWMISAHRDTHFAFLKDIEVGDMFTTTTKDNKIQKFQVSIIEIIDSNNQEIDINDDQLELKLVTCYPLDAIIAGGPLRLVVTAEKLVETKNLIATNNKFL